MRHAFYLLLWLFLTITPLSAGETLRCDNCKTAITGKYSVVKVEGNTLNICPACIEKFRQQAPPCHLCKKRIQGSYTRAQYKGKTLYFCSTCIKKADRCQRCKLPVAKGKTLCPNCQSDAPICTGCGEVIVGAHIGFQNGDRYCAKCQKHARCEACKRPIKPGTGATLGGKQFCDLHKGKIKLCGACGGVIQGRYYSHVFVNENFCERCETGLTHCAVCSRPTPDDDLVMLGGKRPLCPICARSVIVDQKRIDRIYDDSVSVVKYKLKESIYHRPTVTMVEDINSVRREAGFADGDSSELGLFHRKGEAYSIYVLYGISEALAYETLPHEWSHAWFAENGHPKHPQWVEEGFCQWVASHVLRARGYLRSLKVLENREDLYGTGYRYIRHIADRDGDDAVLAYIKSAPPIGAPHRDRNPHPPRPETAPDHADQ